MEKIEAINRLREMQQEIGDLVHEAKDIIKEVAPEEYERARRYWGAHIEGALSKSYGWLGGSFIDMDSTIEAIENDDDGGLKEE
jgi:hypothetical protein